MAFFANHSRRLEDDAYGSGAICAHLMTNKQSTSVSLRPLELGDRFGNASQPANGLLPATTILAGLESHIEMFLRDQTALQFNTAQN
jgi:hypothetical protein